MAKDLLAKITEKLKALPPSRFRLVDKSHGGRYKATIDNFEITIGIGEYDTGYIRIYQGDKLAYRHDDRDLNKLHREISDKVTQYEESKARREDIRIGRELIKIFG